MKFKKFQQLVLLFLFHKFVNIKMKKFILMIYLIYLVSNLYIMVTFLKKKLIFTLLIDIGAYSLPIITSICWLIDGNPPLWITAISNLLLNFKFLLCLRVFKYGGKY